MSFTAEPALVDPTAVAPRAPALVSMRGISKSYSERKILDGISLDVALGEKVALIGPSGSGKTTILRLAIGLVKPDEGTIRIGGDYLWHESGPNGLRPAGEQHARKVRRSVGIVFQHLVPQRKLWVIQSVSVGSGSPDDTANCALATRITVKSCACGAPLRGCGT